MRDQMGDQDEAFMRGMEQIELGQGGGIKMLNTCLKP